MKHISLDTNAYAAFKSGNKNIIEIVQFIKIQFLFQLAEAMFIVNLVRPRYLS